MHRFTFFLRMAALVLLSGSVAHAQVSVGDEVDHNLIPGLAVEMDDVSDAPAIAEEIAPAPKLAEVPVVVKEKKPAVKAAAPVAAAQEPIVQDIPLIETVNDDSHSPDVTYVTGGVGDEEKQAIEAAKADYNLYVMSASASGEFVGDARVVISRKNGKVNEEVLHVVAGPLLYVKLPDGNYALEAKLGEQSKKQNIVIGKKGAVHVHLGWKTN